MKNEIVSKTDLYINGLYYGTIDRALLCTRDEIPEGVNLKGQKGESNTILAIYKDEAVPLETGETLESFFRKMQDEKFKIYWDKQNAKA